MARVDHKELIDTLTRYQERKNYDALVSGDGACAGCGEKSILRAVAAVTEAYMRPLYHAKADRLRAKADRLERQGVQKLAELKARSVDEYELYRRAVAHLVMGLGGEDDKDTAARMAAHGPIFDSSTPGTATSASLAVDGWKRLIAPRLSFTCVAVSRPGATVRSPLTFTGGSTVTSFVPTVTSVAA